jgi:hypothetical protein
MGARLSEISQVSGGSIPYTDKQGRGAALRRQDDGCRSNGSPAVFVEAERRTDVLCNADGPVMEQECRLEIDPAAHEQRG